jgi:heme O synthase-like polyprenyltransferase
MSKNPFYNALSATTYVILIVFLLTLMMSNVSTEDSIIIPIIMISLLTLSVAVMGYIFFYQPVLLFIDKKREEAIKLFLQSVGMFGVITGVIVILYLFGLSI